MDELYQIELFDGVSDEEMEWLLANSYELYLDDGDYFHLEDEMVDLFYVVLEGELQVTATFENGEKTVLGTTPRGIMGGELQLLNQIPSFVTSQAIMPSRVMVFSADAFRQLFAACPLVGSRILKIAAERTQGRAAVRTQQEKMAALGKLSAGLAHELNNPAAASLRAAKTLAETLPELQTRTLKVIRPDLASQTWLDTLVNFQQQMAEKASAASSLSPLEQSDREDEICAWLEERGLENGWEVAPTLVAAGMSVAELAQFAAALPADNLGDVLAWLHTSLQAATLLKEIQQSTQRISDLVTAVKSYTYMDQAALQEVDIHKGLENTLTVLNYKLKKMTVRREYDPNLPHIMGHGGELNQVWTNLLDNAADAAGEGGTITINTRYEQNYVMVSITDNGPGIPPAAQPHLFDPFFTTKEVGRGTGLGLDITYRIVKGHNGVIEFDSVPGRTRFIVRLPIGDPG